MIAPLVALGSALQVLRGAGFLSQTHRQNAGVLELLPHHNPLEVTAPSVAARYSPEGSSTTTEITLAELTLGSN